MAIDLDNSHIKNNTGYQPLNHTIHEDGENPILRNYQIKAMARAIREAGVCGGYNYSQHYVCTHIFLSSAVDARYRFPTIKAASCRIHSYLNKLLHGQTPALSLEDDVKGITAAIAAIVAHDGEDELETVEGKNH